MEGNTPLVMVALKVLVSDADRMQTILLPIFVFQSYVASGANACPVNVSLLYVKGDLM